MKSSILFSILIASASARKCPSQRPATPAAPATPACNWAGQCEGAPCTTWDDCSDDLTCTAGLCAPPSNNGGSSSNGVGGSCTTEADCSGNLVCTDSLCAAPINNGGSSSNGVGASCTTEADCSGNLQCTDSVCAAANTTPSSNRRASSSTKTQRSSSTVGNVLQSGLSGAVTHFDDDKYQCYEWNDRAKSAMKAGYAFCASNFQLVAPSGAPHQLKCGGNQYLCARASNGKECIFVDWCNPNGREACTVAEPGHLDILVGLESNNVDCVDDCGDYQTFKNAQGWELVECSFQINPKDFGVAPPRSDGSSGW